MKINTKTRYGLRTLIYIALESNKKDAILQKDISKAENISFKYLDHIIAELKAANILVTAGGKKSGYKLAKSPGEISLYDIYKAFNSELNLVDCLINNNCIKNNKCAAQFFWNKLSEHIINFMENISLQDIINKQIEFNNNIENLIFYI